MITVFKILEYLNKHGVEYTFIGKDDLSVEGFCSLSELKSGCLTWIRDVNSYDVSKLSGFTNLLVICNEPYVEIVGNFILTQNPHSIYFSILTEFFCKTQQKKHSYIAASSIVETQNIGKNVNIGQHCYIGRDVEIKDNVTIMNNVSIECRAVIGNNTFINSGVVIGMDGYGYFDDIQGNHARVPHLGGVFIGDNVEIGSNTCIAKGCLGDTVINDDVKIDNLCHIAHNVVIGKRSKIIALTMLGGSSIIGEDVWVAPSVAVRNQTTVGKHSLVGMGAVVTRDVEPNKVVAGVPAKVLGNK